MESQEHTKDEQIEDFFDSIHSAIVFSAEDWGNDKRKAWIYGIVCGWDGPALDEICDKYNWRGETRNRLQRLNKRWINAKDKSQSENTEEEFIKWLDRKGMYDILTSADTMQKMFKVWLLCRQE